MAIFTVEPGSVYFTPFRTTFSKARRSRSMSALTVAGTVLVSATLQAAVAAEPFDAALVRKLADSRGQAMVDMIVLRAQGRQEIKVLQERPRAGPRIGRQ